MLFTFWISSQRFIKAREHKNTCPLVWIVDLHFGSLAAGVDGCELWLSFSKECRLFEARGSLVFDVGVVAGVPSSALDTEGTV